MVVGKLVKDFCLLCLRRLVKRYPYYTKLVFKILLAHHNYLRVIWSGTIVPKKPKKYCSIKR